MFNLKHMNNPVVFKLSVIKIKSKLMYFAEWGHMLAKEMYNIKQQQVVLLVQTPTSRQEKHKIGL